MARKNEREGDSPDFKQDKKLLVAQIKIGYLGELNITLQQIRAAASVGLLDRDAAAIESTGIAQSMGRTIKDLNKSLELPAANGRGVKFP